MASANIAFDSIPASIRKPGDYFEYNLKLAVRTLPTNGQKTLVIGQRTAAGTLAANTPVNVFSSDQAALYAGYGSIAHRQVMAAIKANPYLDLTLVLMDDAQGATAASGKVTIANNASAAGSLTLGIGKDYVTVAISAGDTEADIATAIGAAIQNTPELPVTATVNGADVTLTAKNKGGLSNGIPLTTSSTGSSGVIAVVTPMSGGAIDPSPAQALASVFGAGHNVLAVPFQDVTNLVAVRNYLDQVSGPMEQRGAIAALGMTSTLASATTLAAGLDDGRQSVALLPGTVSTSWELGAAYAAVMASEEDPARPLNTLELVGIAVPDCSAWLGRTEQENCLHNGVTPLEIGPGGRVQIVRSVSTYTLNPQGIEDVSLLDMTTIRTLDYTRKACKTRIALRFPREKLSDKTPLKVRSELLDVLYKMEELEIVENVDANKDALICERDLQDVNRVDAAIPADVVNGLHVFAGRIDLIL